MNHLYLHSHHAQIFSRTSNMHLGKSSKQNRKKIVSVKDFASLPFEKAKTLGIQFAILHMATWNSPNRSTESKKLNLTPQPGNLRGSCHFSWGTPPLLSPPQHASLLLSLILFFCLNSPMTYEAAGSCDWILQIFLHFYIQLPPSN